MGIADEEQKILEELRQLDENPETEEKDSEDLLKEVTEDPEEIEEEDLEEEDESGDDEEEEEEEEEEQEEELTGAKFRHKLKAQKEETDRVVREAQDLRERLARLEGKAEAQPKQEVIQEEIPDREYEPEKYANWRADKLEKRVEVMQEEQTRVNAERQWDNMQADHTKTNPDYAAAKAFLLDVEGKKLKAQHPHATDAQISQELKKQEYITVGNAAKNGMMPTQHIEFLAFQAGYRPGAEDKKEVKKKSNIKNIKKNARKNASLIGGSSAGGTGDSRTADQLAAMGLEEIEKFGRPAYEDAIRKLEARG